MNDVQELLKSLTSTENRLLAELVKSVGASIENADEAEAQQHAAAFLLFVRKFMPEALEEADLELPDPTLEKDDESSWQTHLKNVMADNGYYWFGSLEKHYYGEIGSGNEGKDIRGYGPVGAPGPKKVPHSNKRSQKVHGRGSGKRTLIEYAQAYKDLNPDAKLPSREEMIAMSHEAMIEMADKYGFLPETRGGTLNVVDTKEDGANAKLKNRARDIADHASAPERGAGKNFTRKKAIAAVLDTIKENKKLERTHTKGSIKDKDRQLGVAHEGKGPEGSNRDHEGQDKGKKGYGSFDPNETLDNQPAMDSMKAKLQRKAQKAKLKAKRALSPKKKIESLSDAPKPTMSDQPVSPQYVKEQDLAVAAGQTATPPKPKADSKSMLDTLLNPKSPTPAKDSADVGSSGPFKDYSNMNLEGGMNLGGTTGAKLVETGGKKYVVKKNSNNQNRVATELAGNALYNALGANVPVAGKYKGGLAYEMVNGTSKSITEPSAELGKHYMADALLANWDFIGASDDNILWDGDKAIRIDQGGTLFFRAQGGTKDFGVTPTEVESLMLEGQAKGKVAVSYDSLKKQAANIGQTLTDAKIDDIIDGAGFEDTQMAQDAKFSLKGRVNWMKDFANGKVDVSDKFKATLTEGVGEPDAPEAPADITAKVPEGGTKKFLDNVLAAETVTPQQKKLLNNYANGKAADEPAVIEAAKKVKAAIAGKGPGSDAKAAKTARTAAGKLITGLRNSDDITSQNVGTTLLKLLNNPETFDPAKMKASNNAQRQAAQEALKTFHAAWDKAGRPQFAPYGPLTPEQKKEKKALADIKAKTDAGNAPKFKNSKFVETLAGKPEEEKLSALDDLVRQHYAADGKAKVKLFNQMKALQENLLATTDAQKSDLERRVKSVRSKAALEAKNAPKKQATEARLKAFGKLTEKGLRTKLQKANNDLIDLLWKAVDEDSAQGSKGVTDETLLAHVTVDADIKALRSVLKDKFGYDAKQLAPFRSRAVSQNPRSKEAGLPYTKGDWSTAIHDHDEAHTYLKKLENKDLNHPGHKYIKAGTGSWDGIIKGAARDINKARKAAGKALLSTRDLLKPSAANEPEVKPYVSSLTKWADLVNYIDTQGRLTKDVIITRGTYEHDVLGWDINEIDAGQDIIDLMPFNGSPYKDGAPPFRKSPVMVEALVRKGMRIADVNNLLGNHSYSHEHEVLVEPGHVARVISKERNEGKNSAWGAKAWHVRVEFHDGDVTEREGATAISRNKKRQKELEAAKLKAEAERAARKLKRKKTKDKLKDISDQLNGMEKSGTLEKTTAKDLLAKIRKGKQP